MGFETISLLLNWMELGVLLSILFRLGHTFQLIASTQRELRRGIHHLGARRPDEPGINNALDYQGIASVSGSPDVRARTERMIGPDDLAVLAP